MSTQYDNIGKRYKSFNDLPVVEIERPNVLKQLGNVKGLNCLDLACGLGRWSKVLLDQGASNVVGIDISDGMIQAARADLQDSQKDKISFQVGDCSKPVTVEGGPFDVVFAGWFLNYAPDFETMISMWRNIHNNLKPGGRFVTITPNAFCPMWEPAMEFYGISVWVLKEVGEGWQRGWSCRLRANVEPKPIEFDNFVFMHDFYEKAAAEGGMSEVKWHPAVPPDGERKDNGFWDIYLLRPHMNILTATRH